MPKKELENVEEQEIVKKEVAEVQQNQTQPPAIVNPYMPTMWNDSELLAKAWKSAQFLSSTDIVPQTFKKAENCLIALDIANRTGMQPLTVMQNLYVVQGKPSWSGQMCIALINGCGRFTPLEFEFVGEVGTDTHGCYAFAKRLDNGKIYASDIVTIGMAKKEGWYQKSGSKWQSMPIQMMQYRAGAFFGRVHCPDVLMGLPLAEEMKDIEKPQQATSLMNELDEELKLKENK